MDDATWEAYCAEWPTRQRAALLDDMPDYDVIVVDEAQGLVDAAKDYVSGSQASSWRKAYGPEPWHVMMRARLAVFFLDADQGYRQVESTTPADIQRLAEMEGIPCTTLRLEAEQFRLAGAWPYAAWLDRLFGFDGSSLPTITVSERRRLEEVFQFESHPGEMRDRLRHLHEIGDGRARLLAGYAWEWASKDDMARVDSHEGLKLAGRQPPPGLAFRWAGAELQREFNLGTGPYRDGLGLFGEGELLPAVAGYALTVRGRDVDHVGVLWGQDLVRRNGRWIVNHELVFGSDMPQLRVAARNEVEAGRFDGPGMGALVKAVAGAYRILLTRGMETVRVWIEDEETADYVRSAWVRFLNDHTVALATDVETKETAAVHVDA